MAVHTLLRLCRRPRALLAVGAWLPDRWCGLHPRQRPARRPRFLRRRQLRHRTRNSHRLRPGGRRYGPVLPAEEQAHAEIAAEWVRQASRQTVLLPGDIEPAEAVPRHRRADTGGLRWNRPAG